MQGTEKSKIELIIEAANQSGRFFCKFISANDVGLTNAHQEGIYLAKAAWDIFYPAIERVRGTNIEKIIKIHIDSYYPFDSRLIYYGKGTRDEYRITRFWTNSPYQKEQHVGELIIFLPLDHENFKVYMLDTDEDIEEFTEHFSLSLVNNSAVYTSDDGQRTELNKTIEDLINQEAKKFDNFPNTTEMASLSRNLYIYFHQIKKINPDNHLLKWVETEYSVFRAIEKSVYQPYLESPFENMESLLEFANSALNRRKSRAGRSLEHHVSYILSELGIPFDNPGRTEGNKKPDFLFPSTEAYHEKSYHINRLTFLGAKTTCKDRWRQILNEADKIPEKHLLTLQQGITANQLDEMEIEKVTLVVPAPYHKYYPETHRHRLWTIRKFIELLNEKYGMYY